jgi:hypothetical protein
MMEILFVASAFVLMGGVAMLYGDNRAKAKAATAAADAASLAAYQRQLDATAAWMDDHRDRGELPKMICDEVPTGFDQDEEVLCVLPSIDLMELRAVRHSIRRGRSAYGGSTIRVARGLSFRLGGSDSIGHTVSESSDELRQIDNGTLVLTTKRLAFLGSLRTNNSSLDDLIGVKDLGNGIQVHRERKQKAETYLLTSPLIVDGLVVTGAMIQLAIDMAKQLAQGALEGAPPRPLVWKKSPFFEGSGNPLHCGSLYEYEMIAEGALVRSSAEQKERGQREQEKTATEGLSSH